MDTCSPIPEIDRDGLIEFVVEATKIISRNPIPDDVLTIVPDDLTPFEARRLWMAAGIASQIGLALIGDPLRFVQQDPSESF